jgi:DNA-binding CsgD family transcriptional regulator
MSDDKLIHIGVKRRSGRYPWGSGKNPHQRQSSWLDQVDALKKKGITEGKIAEFFELTTTELRAFKTIAKNEVRKAEATQALMLKAKGYSNVAIGERMGKNESSIRALLEPAAQAKREITLVIADKIKEHMSDGSYLDIGSGSEQYMGISKEKLTTAIEVLKQQGYEVKYLRVPQLGTKNLTSVKILTPPGVSYSEVSKNKDKIKVFEQRSDDGGRTFYGLLPPKNVSSKRIEIAYAEDGGALKDGVIELRPGVSDLSLGSKKYAQVRIAVDGSHYLKGMAVYADNLPNGVDIRFNTNKTRTEAPEKLDVMKPLKSDQDNVFGAQIKAGGQRGALNILAEEGDWYNWSGKLSSQMLSKQNPTLIKQQLDLTYKIKKAEFDEIMALTNPTVKRKLLETFADDADSSSATLEAIGLPRTRQHVILPVPQLKDTEIYAPTYNNGERVVLIRHPHGGIFEIPELTVNNRNIAAKKLIGLAEDAIGINPKTAEQLSGADFDGDTVLVIPNNLGLVKTQKQLESLKTFEPRITYKGFEGMKVMGNTQTEMGYVSNLITDMTILGASTPEIVRAVKHSMVVIDAEKHKLNYKQSYIDHGIAELKLKYLGKITGGATTLVSRSRADIDVPFRKPRAVKDGGPINPLTGEKVYTTIGGTYVNKKGEVISLTTKTQRMLEVKDAYELSAGTPREAIYADYANKLKALANESRKVAYQTIPDPYSPTAKVTYDEQVKALNAKLALAIRNRPLERQAQILGNLVISAKLKDNPNMTKKEIKKMKGMAIVEARRRVGAGKQRINITDIEWEAIQAGAISRNKLRSILDNSDLDTVKRLATPRTATVMIPVKVARAQAMLSAGYTQAEIASALGVPVSTLNSALGR